MFSALTTHKLRRDLTRNHVVLKIALAFCPCSGTKWHSPDSALAQGAPQGPCRYALPGGSRVRVLCVAGRGAGRPGHAIRTRHRRRVMSERPKLNHSGIPRTHRLSEFESKTPGRWGGGDFAYSLWWKQTPQFHLTRTPLPPRCPIPAVLCRPFIVGNAPQVPFVILWELRLWLAGKPGSNARHHREFHIEKLWFIGRQCCYNGPCPPFAEDYLTVMGSNILKLCIGLWPPSNYTGLAPAPLKTQQKYIIPPADCSWIRC